MSSIAQLKKKWMDDPDVRGAFIEMTPEFEISRGLIAARIKAGLIQEEVALRMGTTQSVVARLEGGRSLPSMKCFIFPLRSTRFSSTAVAATSASATPVPCDNAYSST